MTIMSREHQSSFLFLGFIIMTIGLGVMLSDVVLHHGFAGVGFTILLIGVIGSVVGVFVDSIIMF